MHKKLLRKFYQKKFDTWKKEMIIIPPQGWIRTMRDFFGMTTIQFAKILGISQARVNRLENNEKNLKISTMEYIAQELNCDFVYAFIPRENINDVLYDLAKEKAMKIIKKVNQNMSLENQLAESEEILNDLTQEFLNGNTARLWDDDGDVYNE